MALSIPSVFTQYQYANWGLVDDQWKIATATQKPLKGSHVRIKVAAAALNPVDYKLAEFSPAWFTRTPTEEEPFIVGFDAAGTVVEVGADVTDFKVGDTVYTRTHNDEFGSVAEYIVVDAQWVALKPKNMSFQEAAGVPLAGLTTYDALVTHANLKAGEKVLILGGSSGTGTYAIQLAKGIGAHVITTASHRNAELVKSLGADQTIEYATQKWAEVLEEHSIDVIYDCGMEPEAWNGAAQKILKKETGRFVTISEKGDSIELIESPIGAKWIYFGCGPSGDKLRALTQFIENGQIKTVVDSVFPLEGTMEAINRVKSGRVAGKVIITVV